MFWGLATLLCAGVVQGTILDALTGKSVSGAVVSDGKLALPASSGG